MLIAVGIDRKSASVSERERLAVPAAELADVARAYAGLAGCDELVLLSTCYRVELYAASAEPAAARAALRSALADRAGGPVPLFELEGEAALRHLLRVACSLESAVVGEPQILGQVKDAHARAAEAGLAGKELQRTLERVYRAAKRVRSETALGRAGISWGHAAATLAEKVLGTVRGKRVAVLGAGEMARLSAQHLAFQGAAITVLSRTFAAAEALAAEVGGSARPADALEEELLLADVVVSAAPAAPPALAPEALAATMRRRRRRDLVLVDLAVPRAIPEAAGAIEGVYLCDVDDLARLTARAQAERAEATLHAERIVEEELARWRQEQAERRAAPVIQALRAHASEIARDEVDRTLKRLGADDPELETRLQAMASAVVSKLLHGPSARLREAVREPAGGERLLAAALQIFALDEAVAVQPRAR